MLKTFQKGGQHNNGPILLKFIARKNCRIAVIRLFTIGLVTVPIKTLKHKSPSTYFFFFKYE